MSAVRPEPVQVQLIEDRPARFVWRGRLYTVLSVIDRPGERPEPGEKGAVGQEADWRCWRVTASAGRNVPPVQFRLCQDQSADRWQLERE